ncbi:uncharacterized mitochondrial protein AtMg00310-like [Coffea arabica]|uniref:Uncharacterized mitochondrial protein AtMg00310-like n=1 Tax=Coffea arabica TaxID=13443 RepID=A0ABM4X4P0_COFAR
MEKSSVFFSRNVERQAQIEICRSLQGVKVVKQGKYLGLPMIITKTNEQIFGFIRDKCQKTILNWRNTQLSQAEKEVLLKAVTMAMLTYAMSCFKLPVRLCKDVNSLIARFWWGEGKGKTKMHWVSWKKMTTAKKAGGLGFKDLQSFNKALLGKQIWRLLTCPNLLLSKVLRARYYPKTTLLSCELNGNALWIWKSLMSAREEVQRGARKQIENGKSTRIWEDAWMLEESKDDMEDAPLQWDGLQENGREY